MCPSSERLVKPYFPHFLTQIPLFLQDSFNAEDADSGGNDSDEESDDVEEDEDEDNPNEAEDEAYMKRLDREAARMSVSPASSPSQGLKVAAGSCQSRTKQGSDTGFPSSCVSVFGMIHAELLKRI